MDYKIFWTFQRRELIFSKSALIYPDFNKNKLITGCSMEAYCHILTDYNDKFNTNYPGLIFGITGGCGVDNIRTKDALYDILKNNGYPGGTVFPPETHVLLKVYVPEVISMTHVDFYRFSDLLFTYDENEPDDIKKGVIDGLYNPNGPNGEWELIQSHIPYISKLWIKETYTPDKI